jgi:pimeloyl-ACP methyl ester carboxylesterase
MHYKTKESETAYLAAYKAAMKSWPVPWEEIEVSNRFGRTYVIASGPEDAPPLVLLHGFFTTLILWTPNISELSKGYRVYAIDIIGNRNRSIPDEPISNSDEIIEWLGLTLTGLGLDCVHLMGMSFGAWLAMKFSMAVPERVKKLALISPAASLLPLVKQFTLRVMLSMLPPKQFWFKSLMGWMGIKGGPGNDFPQRLLNLMWLGTEHIEMSAETMRVMPTVFSDDELGTLRIPVQLLIGENEVIYNAAKALARAKRLIPDLIGELVPNCGHDISFSQYKIVDERVLAFLNADLQDSKM